MYDDKFLNVPFSKSEIFISNDLDLLEKQKLLNFIFSVMKLKNNNVDVNSTVDVKKDIDGNLVKEGTYKIGEHTINLDGSDYPIDYTDDFLEAEYLADTKDLEGYSLSKHFEVKIHGNSNYYFSVKEEQRIKWISI